MFLYSGMKGKHGNKVYVGSTIRTPTYIMGDTVTGYEDKVVIYKYGMFCVAGNNEFDLISLKSLLIPEEEKYIPNFGDVVIKYSTPFEVIRKEKSNG